MSRKIIGITVGTQLPKPNFKQTDPTKGDYIKNKPDFEGLRTDVNDIKTLVGDTSVSDQITDALESGAVLTTTQSLTPEQKAQARKNISVKEDVADALLHLEFVKPIGDEDAPLTENNETFLVVRNEDIFLPEVTTENNGNVLKVVDGKWSMGEIDVPEVESAVTSVNGQTGDVVIDIPSTEGLATEEYVDNAVKAIESSTSVLYTEQELTPEQKVQARTNIGAVSIEEVEELLGIEEEFSVTGEVVEFDLDVEPGTALNVVSKIHRDETWGLSNKLVLHQVSGSNFVDFTSYLGGAGTVFTKNGLTATINADSTITISGTNESTGWGYIINLYRWNGEHSEKVYPAGTYTIPSGFMINVRASQYPNNSVIAGVVANLSGTVTIPEPFRIVSLTYAVRAGTTVDVTLPLGLFRGDSIPETGYEYYGQLYTVTFDAPVYEGEYNWTTGELKDGDGNTVAYYEPQSIGRLHGVNYFWTGFGENTVSNKSNTDLEKVIIRLGESAPEETVPSICDFTLKPTTKNYSINVRGDDRRFFEKGNVFHGMEVPLITTRGKIVAYDTDGEVAYTAAVPELIGYKGISDIMTGNEITKRWSGRFYITREPDIIETIDSGAGNTNDNPNTLASWVFSKSEFEDIGIPVEATDIPIVSPYFIGTSEASLTSKQLTYAEVYNAFFSYDSASDSYIFKCRARSFHAAALYTWTSAYFCYPLKEEVIRTDAMLSMYIGSGYTVNFEQDDAFDPFMEYSLTQGYSPFKTETGGNLWNPNTKPVDSDAAELIDVTPNVGIFVPRSVSDALYEAEHIAKRFNNQVNKKSDYELNNYQWIGMGDGVTDYTEKIQRKLDEVHNTTNGGTVYLGSGTYKISGSLVVYYNTRIIGNGQTVIEQTADNTHAIIVNGSNISIKDLSIKLSGMCTSITACVFVNSDNMPNNSKYDSTLPENIYAQNLTIENVHMAGEYKFVYENGYAVIPDAYDNYKGVGIGNYGNKLYFNYAHIENVIFNFLYAGVYGGGGSNFFNVTSDACRYGMYIINGVNNTCFVNGHSHYATDSSGNYISIGDMIVYVEEGSNSTYHLRCYDAQAFKHYIFLGSRTSTNKIDIQTVLSTGHSMCSDHKWNIIKYYIVDYGWGNVYNDAFKYTPFHIGSRTTTIARGQHLEISNPVIQNALSGAGIWGNISANVDFAGYGITLRDVCRYPSEKVEFSRKNYVPYILSTVAPSENNPIEIVIDYSNRPVHGLPNFFIQFWHENVASDYVVSFDTTNTGEFDFVVPVTDNTNVTDFWDYPMIGDQYTSYRAKFTFTKALQIPNLHASSGSDVFNYNPDGLIGICNIGMTVNDYAGRSFLGECGGSLYGNVDMHQNTLKNLPNPVDDGDAVSKAYVDAQAHNITEAEIDELLALIQ